MDFKLKVSRGVRVCRLKQILYEYHQVDLKSNSVLIFENKMLNKERAFIMNEKVRDGSTLEMHNKGDGGLSLGFYSEIFDSEDIGEQELIEFTKEISEK